jgi:hypothetical protein
MNCVFGKLLCEEAHQLPLPLRVEVQVDFIDEHDGRFLKRVFAVGVALRHAADEVRDPGDERLVAVAELPQRNPPGARLELHPRLRIRPATGLTFNVRNLVFRHDGQEQFLCLREPLL